MAHQSSVFAWYTFKPLIPLGFRPHWPAGGFGTMPRAELLSPIVWGVVLEVLYLWLSEYIKILTIGKLFSFFDRPFLTPSLFVLQAHKT